MAGSLASAFKAAAAAAVSAVGDVATTISYTRKSGGSYNATTGALTVTSTTESVSGVVMDYSDRELNNQSIAVGDRKVLIPGNNFTAITPETGDEMTIGGETYVVIRASVDAAGALWTLQARKQT